MPGAWLAAAVAGAAIFAAPAALATGPLTPWADRVVQYSPGANPAPGFTNPASALGEPSRFTGVGTPFSGPVTPFNPAFTPEELVSLGRGGLLTIAFDEPVTDDPLNPFGIDLLIFGNTGYIDTRFPSGVAGGIFGAGAGRVEVSADGFDWRVATGVTADSPFPTLGYLDLPGPYPASAGVVPTDFTRPVDPAFSPLGRTFAQIVTAYDGAGGGTGVDLASVGLSSISFVRITTPLDAAVTTEIDAIVDAAIPAPVSAMVFMAAGGWLGRRSRRTRS